MGEAADETDQLRKQFSLLSLLVLIASMAVLFAGTRTFGAFGFVFGGCLTMIAVGQMLGQSRWQLGGINGAIVLVATILLCYWNRGTVGEMDARYVQDVKERHAIVRDSLKIYTVEHGNYPEKLTALRELKNAWLADLTTGAEAAASFSYQRHEDSYTLTYLGADQAAGGQHRDLDVSQEMLATFANERVSLKRFLFELPGSNGLTVIIIVSIFTALVSSALPSAGGHPTKRAVISAIAFSVTAILTGLTMAGLHIVLGQSSGH